VYLGAKRRYINTLPFLFLLWLHFERFALLPAWMATCCVCRTGVNGCVISDFVPESSGSSVVRRKSHAAHVVACRSF